MNGTEDSFSKAVFLISFSVPSIKIDTLKNRQIKPCSICQPGGVPLFRGNKMDILNRMFLEAFHETSVTL